MFLRIVYNTLSLSNIKVKHKSFGKWSLSKCSFSPGNSVIKIKMVEANIP